MLHPSYTDLMKVVNQDVEEGDTKIVNSRYSIVLATSKRARQLIDGEEALVPTKPGQKPLSVAIEELNQSKIKIVAEEDLVEEETIAEAEETVEEAVEEVSEESEEEAASEETEEETTQEVEE